MVEQGLIMCVAAGNSGPAASSIVIPGDAENVITVGAIDRSGTIFELSSRGPAANGETKPDLVTLGVDVVSALAGSEERLQLYERHLYGRSSGIRGSGDAAGSKS